MSAFTHLSRLLALATLGTAAAFAPSVAVLRPSLACRATTPVRLKFPEDSDEDTPPASFDISQLSSEVAKRNTAGLRFRQSGPVRKTVQTALDFFSEAGALGRFLKGTFKAVPFYQQMMVLLLLAFGVQSYAPRAAMVAGARVNAAILRGGQYHRLVSPVFLHGGGMHLASNLFSLYRVGPLVEASFGAGRAALLYLLSGVGGNLAGLYFGQARGMSVGASGAVFGMIGATVGYVVRNKAPLGRYGDSLLTNALQILMLNLFIGTRRGSGVDNLAHVGGFVCGAVGGLLFAPSVAPAGFGRGPKVRWDDEDDDDYGGGRGGRGARDDGDGAIVPAWATRGLLAATVVAYAVGLRDATNMARAVLLRYGRV